MWADTLLAAERAHLLRVAMWAMASIVAGTSIFLIGRIRPGAAPVLRQFAVLSVTCGVVELAIVWGRRSSIGLRDLAGARQLERLLWLNCGLDVGYLGVGVTLALACWFVGRRLGGVGAGIGIATQGVALLWLDLVFANALSGAI